MQHHWRGIAQVATSVGIGLGAAACVAASDGMCALALPYIGGLGGMAIYAESSGQHTAAGYGLAFAEGGIAGSVALACFVACEWAGGLFAGGVLVNGSWGAAQGMWDYGQSACSHSPGGYISAGIGGFLQGGVPWDQLWK